jgi:hypothetical protein
MSPKIKLSTVAFVLAACVATSISAFAEDAPARVRGTFQKMGGNNLTIATKSGKETNVPLKDGAPVIAVTKGAMDVGHKEQYVRRHHRHAATGWDSKGG